MNINPLSILEHVTRELINENPAVAIETSFGLFQTKSLVEIVDLSVNLDRAIDAWADDHTEHNESDALKVLIKKSVDDETGAVTYACTHCDKVYDMGINIEPYAPNEEEG